MASNSPKRTRHKKKNSKEEKPKANLVQRMNVFFEKNNHLFLYGLLILHALFGFLLFDFKVSIGGDDSGYIFMGYRLIKEGSFPTFQGPLYPLVLGVFIAMFGIKLTLLKSLSLVFILVHFYFFYKAFYKRVPSFILFFTMMIVALNAYILYFASQTYSEAFFLMLQGIFFYFFFRNFIDKEPAGDIKKAYPVYLTLGLLIMLMGLSRSLGYGVFIVVMLYFLLKLRWKHMAYTLASFSAFYALVHFVKKIGFGEGSSQFANQLSSLMQKDFYNASAGREDLAGFVERFFGNLNQYISHHFYKFFGFREHYADDMTFLSIITVALFIAGIYFVITHKDDYLLFNGIYIGVLTGITFVILHLRWDQGRLILVFFPVLFLFLIYTLYQLSNLKQFNWLKLPFFLLLIVIFFTNLQVLATRVKENKDELAHGIRGDRYYGYSPDWINYLKMSEYAAENVPEDVNIASRKSNMSFIYGERYFYRIGNVPTTDPDQLIERLQKANVHYVIMASLRRNPLKKTQYTINTVKRYLYYIQRKYPYSLQMVHKIGNDEPAFLYKIHYENLDRVNPDYEPLENVE